jgi:hypothetical protein
MSGNTILAGYEQKVNAKLELICDHAGPPSYKNVSTAAKAGDVVNALDFQRGGIEIVLPSVQISASGNYAVRAYMTQTLGAVGKTVQLRWFSYPAAATTGALGAEVADGTDLSAESVRLLLRLV